MSIPEETKVATTGGPTLSRRTLAKGAAWSVPVLAASAAAPVYACSIEPAPGVSLSRDTTTCSTTVTWSQVKGHTKYEIQYRVEGSDTVHTVSPSPVTGTSHTILNPTNVTEVRVRVYNPPCESTWSNWISNRPAAPTGVKANFRNHGFLLSEITVSWDEVLDAQEYKVRYSLERTFLDPLTNTVIVDESPYQVDLSPAIGQSITAQVQANVCGVWSEWSSQATRMATKQEIAEAEAAYKRSQTSDAKQQVDAATRESVGTNSSIPQSPASKPSASASQPQASSTPKPQASSTPTLDVPAAPEPPVAPPADPEPVVEVVPEG